MVPLLPTLLDCRNAESKLILRYIKICVHNLSLDIIIKRKHTATHVNAMLCVFKYLL